MSYLHVVVLINNIQVRRRCVAQIFYEYAIRAGQYRYIDDFIYYLSVSLSSFLFSLSICQVTLMPSLLNALGFSCFNSKGQSRSSLSLSVSLSLSLSSLLIYLSVRWLMLTAPGFNSKGLAAMVKSFLSLSVSLSLSLSLSLLSYSIYLSGGLCLLCSLLRASIARCIAAIVKSGTVSRT